MIKIKNSNNKEGNLIFTTDMSLSLANAIRRSAMEIPILAIDEVEIIKNDSALYDEVISHRLGLVPIKTDKSTKEIKFKLREAGPKTVYSTDIKPSVETDMKLPIVLLEEEQELEVVCEARLGKGIEHAKYSPGLIYFKHDIDEDVLDYVTVDDEGKVTYDEDEIHSKNISEEQAAKIKKMKNANELEFHIESWWQLKPNDIFLRAIDALNDNLDELNKEIK